MNEEEKLALAKKNYETFLNKEYQPTPLYNYNPTTLKLKNGKTILNMHWCDNEITPTRFYRWLTAQQRTDNGQIVEVTLDERLFAQLEHMVANKEYPITFGDVIVTKG